MIKDCAKGTKTISNLGANPVKDKVLFRETQKRLELSRGGDKPKLIRPEILKTIPAPRFEAISKNPYISRNKRILARNKLFVNTWPYTSKA